MNRNPRFAAIPATAAARFVSVAFFTAALALAAPVARADDHSWLRLSGGSMLAGSGKLQTEARAVGSFSALTLRGSMKVVLRQGSKEAVQVEADDNLLPLVETRVVEHAGVPTLEVGLKPGSGFRSHHEITVTVDVVTLSALAIRGSGDVFADGLKTPSLKLDMSGSGDIHLTRFDGAEFSVQIAGNGDVTASGRAAKVRLGIAGSGDIDTTGLDADDVSIDIAGSGDASVNAHKTLAVSIAGSGDVSYVGDAVVKSSIAGSGSVKKR